MGKDFLACHLKMRHLVKLIQDIVQYCIEKLLKNTNFNRKVFMFHVVSDNRENWYNKDYSISMKNFSMFVDKIQHAGFEIVSSLDFFKNDGKKKVLLTFDDAYSCIYEEVFPFLRDKDIPFIVFQTWDLLGKNKYLNQEMIREMLKFNKFELGAHSISHSRLSDMDDEMSFIEIRNSKTNLEQCFNVSIYGMAYPYGAMSDVKFRDMNFTKKAGYNYAFGTVSIGISSKIKGKFYLPRINVNQENYRIIISRCL